MSDYQSASGEYVGERNEIFWLVLKTSLLTLITLGIYRFWARTRIRRFIWSSTGLCGDRLEYTGTGLEKFLGFLVAVVVLAVYLGIIQLVLTFIGFNMFGAIFSEPTSEEAMLAQVASIYIVLLALLPLILFAQYRAMRYTLSRTRWRGVRFGMDKAAFQYMWRGLLWGLISILTLGLAMPAARFKLTKFMQDRTYFGTAKFEQGGNWKLLYGAAKHILFAILFIVAIAVIGGVANLPGLVVAGILLGYFYLLVAFVYYQTVGYNRLMGEMKLDGVVGFSATASTGTVIMNVLAGFGMTILAVIGFLIIMFILGMALGGNLLSPDAMESIFMSGAAATLGILMFVLYLGLIAVIGAIVMAFTTQPNFAHFVMQTEIQNTDHLATIQQRDADDMADADGFADALDIGGAI